jgi:hypothetical protein
LSAAHISAMAPSEAINAPTFFELMIRTNSWLQTTWTKR